MPVPFIQSLELRQLPVRFVFLFQPRVCEKQLIMHSGIFWVELDATRKQRQRLFVTLQLHQQPPEIVIRRKSIWIELNCASQQTLSFFVFSALTRNVTKVPKHVRVVRL